MSTDPSEDNSLQLIEKARRLQDAIASACTRDVALETTLSAAEVSMQALKLTEDSSLRKQLSAQVKSLLSQAEQIKVNGIWNSSNSIKNPTVEDSKKISVRKLKPPISTRQLSTAEKIIVLKGSYLNGYKFPPWQTDPTKDEFNLAKGQTQFTDKGDLRLSPTQLECFDAWKRPINALRLVMTAEDVDREPEGVGLNMLITDKHNLVQDAATDCSVVASLCAGTARFSRGHLTIFSGLLYPYNFEIEQPELSPSGKYVLKYNFNGAHRRVEIDDRLPVSKTDRVIHVVDRNNPSTLWPALIEKAYLKVRGGYDFLGSNSGTDLWVTCGWIPEQIFLSEHSTSVFDVWDKVHKAFDFGDVLVTVGTAKMSEALEHQTGLIGLHDYAVIDMKDVDGQRFMLIKNPWCEGPTWRSRTLDSSADSSKELDADVQSPRDLLDADSQLSPGTFWMDLNNIAQNFDAVYLNWNPGLFSHRQDIHFSWDLTQRPNQNSLANNPQFTFSLSQGGVAWLLLCRHFQSTVPRSESTEDVVQSPGYINIFVYNARGIRVFLNEFALARGNFVDSPQVLLRLDALEPNHPYTVVAMQDSLAAGIQTFTLCAWGNAAMTLEQARDGLSHQSKLSAFWNAETAGGNTHSPLYSQNPQFGIVVPSRTPLTLFLETTEPDLPVHVKLVHSQSQRVQSVRSRDIVFDSKDHRRGCALAQTRDLEAGRYTIICSTFEPGQTGDFTIRVDSTVPVQMSRLPRLGSGRIMTALTPAVFRTDQRRLGAPLTPHRLSKVSLLVRHRSIDPSSSGTVPSGQHRSQERSMIRVSVESWSGRLEQDQILTISGGGEYSDSFSGVLTNEIDLNASMARYAGLWLVVERMPSAKDLAQESFAIEMFIETPQALSAGEWRCLDD